jgi:hypothetical protein
VSAGWVAGSVRAAAMARRRLGPVATLTVAGCARLDEGLDMVAGSPYGRQVTTGVALDVAEYGVAATLLWNLRVLAGWLPAGGAEILRVLAGWFEIANTDEHVRALSGVASGPPPYRLGSLATAWPQLAATGSAADLRAALAASPWGDPGAQTPFAIGSTMRVAWAQRVALTVPAARPWAAGGAALMVARERFLRGSELPTVTTGSLGALLGGAWAEVPTLAAYATALRPDAAWALAGVTDDLSLWRAETLWWRRVHTDGLALLGRSGFGQDRVVGAAAVLAADAWRVRAALGVAARGGAGREARDALA